MPQSKADEPWQRYTMPLENMKALFETVREIQAGEHDN